MKICTAAVILLVSAGLIQADQNISNVQQALKDEGFYYGEITGEKDADTTAAIRRYQIRNGLQITGDLNEETLKALGIDASGYHPAVKASPTADAGGSERENSDNRGERGDSSRPTNPLNGQPLPEPAKPSEDQQSSRRNPDDVNDEAQPTEPEGSRAGQPGFAPGYAPGPRRSGENFVGTPYEASPPEVQRNVIISAQNILARRGLYRGVIDGNAGPDLEFSLRAYQARVHIPVTGKLDLATLAALQLLPAGRGPMYVPRRPLREKPVRGEWVPER